MDLLDLISEAHQGRGLHNIGDQFGLDENQTRSALDQLAPVLAAGLRRNVSTQDGLLSLLKALNDGSHDNYLDDPDAIRFDRVRDDGNAILGHILGSKDASREVAMHAAGGTGIGGAILKKLLPIIAAMVMGSLAKKMGGGSASQPRRPSGGGLGDVLTDILGGGGRAAPQDGGGGLGDILGQIVRGGARSPGDPARRGGGYGDVLSEDQFSRGRDVLEDALGRGSPSAGTAEDLLNSVERHLRRRR